MNKYLQQAGRIPEFDLSAQHQLGRARGILSNLRLLIGVALTVALIGSIYALTVVPVYQANMLIQIKRSAAAGAELQADNLAATEVEILRSRSVLARVVTALQLDIHAEPKRLPVLGNYLSRKNQGPGKPGLFGYGGYAWGKERVAIHRFSVPDALMNHTFELTFTGNGRYRLTQEESGISLRGVAGRAARAVTPYGDVDLLVGGFQARPGVSFLLSRTPVVQVVDQLQRSLAISENGKQSNVISVSLKGSKPELISRILNEIGSEYIRQHSTQRSSATADALSFYNEQLKESNERLRRLDASFSQAVGRHGVTDLAEESRMLSQQSISLQERLAAAEAKQYELSSRYLAQHPAMIVANEQILALKRELASTQAKRRALAAADQGIIGVTREKQANAELNASILSARDKINAQASSNLADVRVVDRAETPFQPLTLGLRAMIALACVAGIAAGILASIIKNAIAESRAPAVPRYDGQFRLV